MRTAAAMSTHTGTATPIAILAPLDKSEERFWSWAGFDGWALEVVGGPTLAADEVDETDEIDEAEECAELFTPAFLALGLPRWPTAHWPVLGTTGTVWLEEEVPNRSVPVP